MAYNCLSSSFMVLLLGAALVPLSGCGKQDNKSKDQVALIKDAAKAPQKDGDAKGKHEGWWCQEHGIPEHMCSLCSDEVAAKLKREGDWCKIHDRAQSQCFKCDPSKYKKFEDMYVAKYDKKPVPPPDEEFKK